jgi:hypothetical protein
MNIRVLVGALAAATLLAAPAGALAFNDSLADDTGFQINQFSNQFKGIQSNAGLIDTIIRIINALLVLAAIAAIVFVIIGGVRYITSQGDEDAAVQAKNTIIYAIIGIIIIILAAVIVNFFASQTQP